MPAPTIETLRPLLHTPNPTLQDWQRIVDLFTPGETTPDLVADYMRSHFQTWPETLRRPVNAPFLLEMLRHPETPIPPLFNTLRTHAAIADQEIQFRHHRLAARLFNLTTPLRRADWMRRVTLLSARGVHALFQSASLSDIQHLKSPIASFTYKLRDTFRTPISNTRNLRTLDLSSGWMRDDDLIALFNSCDLSNLRALHFEHYKLNHCGQVLFRRMPPLPQLEHLNLSSSNLTSTALGSISKSPSFPKLRSLDLSDNELTETGLKHLASIHRKTPLHTIDISFNKLTPKPLRDLFNTEHTQHLHTLDISSTQLTITGAQTLALSPHLNALRVLSIGGNAFTTKHLNALLHTDNFTHLRVLSLRHTTSLRGEVLETFCKRARLPSLTTLYLDTCDHNNNDLAIFAKHAHLPSLTTLHIHDSSFETDTLKTLVASPGLPSLKTLHINKPLFLDEDLQAIQTAADRPIRIVQPQPIHIAQP